MTKPTPANVVLAEKLAYVYLRLAEGTERPLRESVEEAAQLIADHAQPKWKKTKYAPKNKYGIICHLAEDGKVTCVFGNAGDMVTIHNKGEVSAITATHWMELPNLKMGLNDD